MRLQHKIGQHEQNQNQSKEQNQNQSKEHHQNQSKEHQQQHIINPGPNISKPLGKASKSILPLIPTEEAFFALKKNNLLECTGSRSSWSIFHL